MGFFSKLTKTAFDAVTAPIEVVKDAATLGGLCTGEDEPYTVKRLKRLQDDLEETRDSLDD